MDCPKRGKVSWPLAGRKYLESHWIGGWEELTFHIPHHMIWFTHGGLLLYKFSVIEEDQKLKGLRRTGGGYRKVDGSRYFESGQVSWVYITDWS